MSVITSTPEVGVHQTPEIDARQQAARLVETIGVALAVLALVIAVGGMIYLFSTAIAWYNRPFLGVLTNEGLVISDARPVAQTGWNGLDSGLRTGDRIVSVTSESGHQAQFDPADPTSASRFNQLLVTLSRGDIVQVQVARPAPVYEAAACSNFTTSGALCSYGVELSAMPTFDFLLEFGLGFLIGLILLGIGIGVMLIGSAQRSARWLALICASGALLITGQFDMASSHEATWLWLLAMCALGAGLGALASTFPYSLPSIYRLPWLSFTPLFIALGWFVISLIIYTVPQTRLYDTAPIFASIGTAFGAVGVATAALQRRRFSPSVLNREQAGLALIGFLISATPVVIWVAATLAGHVLGWTWLSFPLFYTYIPLLLFPLSLAYAMFQKQLFNSDLALTEGLIYAVLGLTLIVGYSLITFALYWLTGGQLRWDNPLPVALAIVVIAIAFSPARRRLELVINQTFFKQRHVYESRLEQFARRLTQVMDVSDVMREVRGQLDETVLPEYILAFVRNSDSGEYEAVPDSITGKRGTDVRFSPGSPLLSYLNRENSVLHLLPGQPLPPDLASERSRLAVLNTPVIARMRTSSRLNGFLALGPRRDRTIYPFEDLRFVEGLSDQAALALERAQVIIEAQRSEQELKVLSQASTALNITMDFDTLLEFIFAQTDKIVRARKF